MDFFIGSEPSTKYQIILKNFSFARTGTPIAEPYVLVSTLSKTLDNKYTVIMF